MDAYSLINTRQSSTDSPSKPFDKEAWKQRKRQEREDAYALGDDTALRVNADPKALDGYLDVMARFPERSALNSLLIFAQHPDATRIGDKAYWRNEHALIRKGERGFTLIEQGDGYERADGSIGSFFNAVRVYDEGQTTARRILPRRYQEAAVVAALVKTTIPRIVPADDLQGDLAVYDHENGTVYLQKGLSQSQVFWALACELCQSEFARSNPDYDREAYLGRAELGATVLAKRYGINSPYGDAPALASKDANAKEVREALSDVQAAVKAVSRQAARELDKPKEREGALDR